MNILFIYMIDEELIDFYPLLQFLLAIQSY
jgi:hypothetical protein